MTERDVQHDIRRALAGFPAARLFRFQSGRFWQGVIAAQGHDYVVLHHPRRVNVGFEGLADLGGWVEREITPNMVGTRVAQFAAIEVKEMGKITKAQDAYLHTVRSMGGLAGVATTALEAQRILRLG
jgi:hypothetical protein